MIVPALTCAAPARLSVKASGSSTVPWLSSTAASVRGPPAPTSDAIVPVAAFTKGPVVTVSDAPNAPVISVSSISPVFVKPFVIVAFAVLVPLAPRTSITDVSPVVTDPFTVVVPRSTSRPLFTSPIPYVPPVSVIVPALLEDPVPVTLPPLAIVSAPVEATCSGPVRRSTRVPTASV